MNQERGTALITGASMGIGAELAKVFAENRHPLVLVARSEQQLQTLATELREKYQVQVTVIAKDLVPAEEREQLLLEVKRQNLAIDILVNNAGIGTYGLFMDTDWEREHQMLQLNMVALTHLTKLFLPQMRQRKRGRIMNVASTAAFQPGPLMACYYASKAYVLLFSEALANELGGSGITVTALCPGPTRTAFHESAKTEKSNMLKRPDVMDAATVARVGYKGMMKGKTIIIPGTLNKMLALSSRTAPRRLLTAIVRKLNE